MKAPGDPTQEAADWLARLRSENLSEMEEARFRAWLSGDPARRREFDALNTMWEELDRVAQSPAVLAARNGLQRKGSQHDDAQRTSERGVQRASDPPRISRRAVVGWAMAAGVASAAGFVSWQRWLASGHYETLVGEQRTVPLADGSIITLNTSSRVHVRLGAKERRISLLQGQAQFEVAKDASRPFIVSVGRGEVRALGTAFDVYRREGARARRGRRRRHAARRSSYRRERCGKQRAATRPAARQSVSRAVRRPAWIAARSARAGMARAATPRATSRLRSPVTKSSLPPASKPPSPSTAQTSSAGAPI